jgi:hypothetical protein
MDHPGAAGLKLRSRGQTYTLLVGVVVGLLVAGLGIPFVFGTPLDGARGTPQVADGGAAEDGEPLQAVSGPQEDDGRMPDGEGQEQREAAADPATAGGNDGTATATATEAGGGDSGDASTPDDDSASDRSGGDGPALTASDDGVTEEAIELGLLLLDVAQLGDIGVGLPGIDPETQREGWQAFIDEVNEAGGINGRRIEPVYRSYDPLDQDSGRAACLYLTQDRNVFAAMDSGGLVGGNVRCITDENDTTMLTTGSQGVLDELYEAAPGRLFGLLQRSSRLIDNLAAELDGLGVLDGATPGILVTEDDAHMARRLEQRLAERGHDVAYTGVLAQEYSQGTSQISLEVQQMRANGVDAVIKLVHIIYGTQFVQIADGQNYHPQYLASDWRNASIDVHGEGMPDSYDGTLAITAWRTNEARAGLPEAEDAAACREIYERRTGKELERDSDDYGLYVGMCTLVDVFRRGATGAGPELTRDAFATSMRGLGEVPLGMFVGGSFTEAKSDAADYVRTVRWDSDCRCHMPVDDLRATRY